MGLMGPEETRDVIAAANFITNHNDCKNANIGLLSICMGTSVITYAYGLQPGLQAIPNIKAMIAVQPLHYGEFIKAFGLPKFLDKRGRKLSEKRLGFDLNEKTFLTDVDKITVPTMVVQNKNDPWTNIDSVKDFYDRLRVEKEILWLDLAKSRPAGYNNLGKSPEHLSTFFSKHL